MEECHNLGVVTIDIVNRITVTDRLYQNITIIKAVAIVMMIVHHFLGFPLWLEEANQLINIPIVSSLRVSVGQQCKICVALYAFVTGYSVYVRRCKYTIKYVLIKLLNLFSIYWTCNLVILTIGFLFMEPMPNFRQVLLTALGLGVEMNVPYVNNPFAWYVFCYMVIVFSIPFISDLLDRRDVLKGMIILGIEILLFVLAKYITWGNIFRIEAYINYMFVAVAGSICAKFNIYNRMI